MRLITGLLLVVAICCSVVAVLLPSARESARRTSCQSNLSAIGKGIQMYQMDYSNYPSSLEIFAKMFPAAKLFICPSSDHQTGSVTNVSDWTDYYYVSGVKPSDPKECLLAYCSSPKHKGGIALFLDTSTKYLTPSDLHTITNNFGITNQAVLAEIRSRVRIIRGTGQIRK